jgi:hypothetical protein
MLARLCAHSLDRRLASGEEPESGRLLATRAGRLVSASRRAALAQNWEHVLERAAQAPVARSSQAPLCRDRIVGAEGDIRAMTETLMNDRPTSARGVAVAALLLGDASSPVYNRRSATNLTVVVRNIMRDLDPAEALAH